MKGEIDILFSKLSFLVISLILGSTFTYIFLLQVEILGSEDISRRCENLARVIDSLYSFYGNQELSYEIGVNGEHKYLQ
jgi:hypothetical protein